MSKDEYNKDDFRIILHRDTITLGKEFTGDFLLTSKDYKIEIVEPTREFIVIDSMSNGIETYKFKPLKSGLYDFTGRLYLDSLVIPFAMKFIVIEN